MELFELLNITVRLKSDFDDGDILIGIPLLILIFIYIIIKIKGNEKD